MKITLIGYGKMGKAVELEALAAGHTIVSIIDPKSALKTISKDSLEGSDLCIDFTHPKQVLKNLEAVAQCGKNLVIGTTGWYEDLPKAKEIVGLSQIGCIYAPNFSLGIAIFMQIVEAAAKAMAPFDQYDLAGLELHHREKIDAPSGTALALVEKIKKNISSKKDIGFSSVRLGSVPGTHSILFNSLADTIELTHTAHNRTGFAAGVLSAAKWILNKKGLFTLDDLLKAIYEKD